MTPHPAAAPAQGEPTHTPGQWHARPPQGRARLHGVFSDDNYCLAECMGQEAVANARLISAAPDLLAAIINSDDAHWTSAMRAAIAKATGATP